MATPRTQEVLTYQISGLVTTVSHPVRDGANRLMLVELMGRFESVTSVTYGGNAVDLVSGSDAGAGTAGTAHRHVRLARMIAPAVGTADLVVTITGNTGSATIRVRNLIDVDQSTPLRSQGGSNYAVSASGTSSTGDTLTPTTVADDLVLDLIAVSTTPTIGSGQTLAGSGGQPTNQRSSTRVATGGSENMAWTYSSGTFAHCAVSIIGSAATQPDPADFSGTAGKKSWHVSSTLTGESVSSGATVYVSLAPGIESSGTESLNRTRIRVPGTISGLSLTVSVNATTSDSTVTVLEDGASTGVTITIPAGTTGTFAASGDVSVDGTTALSLQVTNGGGGSLTMTASSFAFEADDAETMTLLAAHSSSALQTSAATTTYLRASGSRGSDPDETDATIRVPIAATWEGIEVIKVGNTTTATVDVASRISGANGNQALSWVSSGASSEEDTTNSDTLADGDDIAWQIVAGAGSGTWETERWTSRLLTSNGRFLFVAGGVPGDGLALSNGLNYIPLAGELKVTTTEANAQQEAPFDLTAYRLAVAVGTNTSLLPTMVRLRVNGADASQWVELQPGIADVYYADVWATDDVDAGDLVCIEADCAGANSTVRIRYVALVGVERSAAPSLPSLSASTYKPGTLTSTGWTPRVTAT
jgi:hypothetical protein